MKKTSASQPETKTEPTTSGVPEAEEKRSITTEPDTYDDEEQLSPFREIVRAMAIAIDSGGAPVVHFHELITNAMQGSRADAETLVKQLELLRTASERAHGVAMECFWTKQR